jgi:type IV secretory pathway VirB2 component (pilin)
MNTKETKKHNIRLLKVTFAVLLSFAAIFPELAFAGAPWQTTAQSIYSAFFASAFVKILAAIALGACGLMAFMGKMEWKWVLNIGIGLLLIFGGSQIVNMLSGQQ